MSHSVEPQTDEIQSLVARFRHRLYALDATLRSIAHSPSWGGRAMRRRQARLHRCLKLCDIIERAIVYQQKDQIATTLLDIPLHRSFGPIEYKALTHAILQLTQALAEHAAMASTLHRCILRLQEGRLGYIRRTLALAKLKRYLRQLNLALSGIRLDKSQTSALTEELLELCTLQLKGSDSLTKLTTVYHYVQDLYQQLAVQRSHLDEELARNQAMKVWLQREEVALEYYWPSEPILPPKRSIEDPNLLADAAALLENLATGLSHSKEPGSSSVPTA